MGRKIRSTPEALLPIDACRQKGAGPPAHCLGHVFRCSQSRRAYQARVDEQVHMDWKATIRESAMKSGVVLDEDIVEELSDHAGIVYQTMRSDGSEPAEAEQHV